jgi:hypothetical protein
MLQTTFNVLYTWIAMDDFLDQIMADETEFGETVNWIQAIETNSGSSRFFSFRLPSSFAIKRAFVFRQFIPTKPNCISQPST